MILLLLSVTHDITAISLLLHSATFDLTAMTLLLHSVAHNRNDFTVTFCHF